MSRRVCLAIETTGAYLGLALHDLAAKNFPCLARFFESTPGQQAELLFPTLTRLLASKRLKRSDLALIAVDHGPGSFTGARVGVASARAVAQSLNLPLIGIDSLAALASEAGEQAAPGSLVAARLTAVSDESYFAVYRAGAKGVWTAIQPPAWMTDAAAGKHLARLAKKGAHLAYATRPGETLTFPPGLSLHPLPAPDPSMIARLALAAGGSRPSAAAFPYEKVAPVYLLPSWAERSRKAAKAKGA